ncbi:MAG: hypothetical protein ACKVP2_09895 [Burkholderiales bacterium]
MFIDTSNLTARPARSVFQLAQEGIQTLFLFCLFALMWLGFAGLAYKALHEGGWVDGLLAHLWRQHPSATVVTVVMAIVAGVWTKKYTDSVAMFGNRGDYLVYGCLGLGLFFAIKFAFTGFI